MNFDNYKKRLARLYCGNDVCGGGLLLDDQYIITCYHLFEECRKYNDSRIVFDFPFRDMGEKIPAQISDYEPKEMTSKGPKGDIALFKLDKAIDNAGFAPLELKRHLYQDNFFFYWISSSTS